MRLKKRMGFTLIELMITVVILSIVGVSLYSLRTENILANQNHILKQQVIWALQSQAAILESKAYSSLPSAGSIPFSEELGEALDIPRSKGTILVEDAAEDLKKFTLKMMYQDARMAERELSLVMYRSSK